MARALIARLEALASELVQRRWAARAALVSDEGEVVALCSPRGASTERTRPGAGSDGGAAHATDDESPTAAGLEASEVVAKMVVDALDEQTWIYVDLGATRLVARLTRPSHATAATTWIAAELRRLGVTVERESLAQD